MGEKRKFMNDKAQIYKGLEQHKSNRNEIVTEKVNLLSFDFTEAELFETVKVQDVFTTSVKIKIAKGKSLRTDNKEMYQMCVLLIDLIALWTMLLLFSSCYWLPLKPLF